MIQYELDKKYVKNNILQDFNIQEDITIQLEADANVLLDYNDYNLMYICNIFKGYHIMVIINRLLKYFTMTQNNTKVTFKKKSYNYGILIGHVMCNKIINNRINKIEYSLLDNNSFDETICYINISSKIIFNIIENLLSILNSNNYSRLGEIIELLPEPIANGSKKFDKQGLFLRKYLDNIYQRCISDNICLINPKNPDHVNINYSLFYAYEVDNSIFNNNFFHNMKKVFVLPSDLSKIDVHNYFSSISPRSDKVDGETLYDEQKKK